MNRKMIFMLLMTFCIGIDAQISLVNTFSSSVTVFKTHNNGYKAYEVKSSPLGIYIYNVDNTVFSSFAVPSQTFAAPTKVGYISQNLFDLDSDMEYFVYYMINPTYGRFYIYNEDGTVLFYRDSVTQTQKSVEHTHASNVADFIYHDGTSTKMKLDVGVGNVRNEIYSLPGTIPCIDCSVGSASPSAVTASSDVDSNNSGFYSPADQLKLKYILPEGVHKAELRIQDTQGNVVDELKVTDSFDFIYLPVNFNDGTYQYSLVVEGKVIKTEKIVLNK